MAVVFTFAPLWMDLQQDFSLPTASDGSSAADFSIVVCVHRSCWMPVEPFVASFLAAKLAIAEEYFPSQVAL